MFSGYVRYRGIERKGWVGFILSTKLDDNDESDSQIHMYPSARLAYSVEHQLIDLKAAGSYPTSGGQVFAYTSFRPQKSCQFNFNGKTRKAKSNHMGAHCDGSMNFRDNLFH